MPVSIIPIGFFIETNEKNNTIIAQAYKIASHAVQLDKPE